MWDWSLHLYWYWMPTKFWVKNKGGRVWLKIALRLQAELTFITYIYFPFTTALIPWWWFILYGRKKEGFSPVCEITLMGCWVDVIFGINLWQYLPAGTNERMEECHFESLMNTANCVLLYLNFFFIGKYYWRRAYLWTQVACLAIHDEWLEACASLDCLLQTIQGKQNRPAGELSFCFIALYFHQLNDKWSYTVLNR